MLYAIGNDPSPAAAVDAALTGLRAIVVHRLQTHAQGQPLVLLQWLPQHFNGQLLRPELLRHLPQLQTDEEWIVLLLALVPHVLPNFFEAIILEQFPSGGDFPEIGGVKGGNHRSMLPTGETAQFVLFGNEIGGRLSAHQLFSEAHFFYRQRILWLEPVREGEPFMSGRIIMDSEWVNKILLGKETAPRFGLDFPAKRITTNMLWEDVVLHHQTAQQVHDVQVWLEHHHELQQEEHLFRKIKPGYRVLFYGPPGTGKTLTATLLGKQFHCDVYRIDLSQIVSKYIGETEKNLEAVFKKAEAKNWILFFDEADALFGKRTNVQSSHDKYANQEVSYLLQRVEDYPGLIILASNFKNNLDDAFIRRFHALVHFPVPNAQERLVLWQKALPQKMAVDEQVNLPECAQKYELTGAGIISVMHYAALQCLASRNGFITYQHIKEGIRREYMKEEKTM
ncbi:ATP-binding protein [Pseudocnuella soli]|uniref:ATP-binding protein n=1 Tax=Pseudocnuella soli TaxID=2502779 RepID=UPI00104AD080|nr:ATP-binding protein [Pseudocnuella soli]